LSRACRQIFKNDDDLEALAPFEQSNNAYSLSTSVMDNKKDNIEMGSIAIETSDATREEETYQADVGVSPRNQVNSRRSSEITQASSEV